MNDSVHFFEHSVIKKYEGAYGRRRALAILLYILCPILLLILLLMLIGTAAVIWFVPLSPMAIIAIVKMTYERFFKIEYEYIIAKSTLTVTMVGGRHHRKELFSARLSECAYIGPAGQLPADLERDKVVYAAASMKSPDLYVALHGKTALYFEPTTKMLRSLQLYNRNTVLTEVRC